MEDIPAGGISLQDALNIIAIVKEDPTAIFNFTNSAELVAVVGDLNTMRNFPH